MKILYIIPDFHHPLVPGSHRHYHFIKELSKRHKITLFSLVQKAVPNAALKEMRTYTQKIHMFSVADVKENTNSRLSKEMQLRETIRQMHEAFRALTLAESFDVVMFHGKILYPLIADCDIPVVIDFCDATSMRLQIQMRHESVRKLPLRFTRYLIAKKNEKNLLRKSDQVAFISARDRSAIVGPGSRLSVVTNGVDLDFWTPKQRRPEPHTIAMTGVMNYQPNEDAAMILIRKIMPVLRQQLENPRLLLIGRSPTPALEKEGALHDDVTVTGFVDDVRPYLEQASVFVAPIYFASGMQNKVLEAMAMNLPVVTTSMVAEGVEINGREELPVVVADEETKFAEEVIRLLNNPDEQQRLGKAGRAFVERHFVWTESAAKFEQMCLDAIAARETAPTRI